MWFRRDHLRLDTSLGAVLQRAIANGGSRLHQPPIGASIKLAVSATSRSRPELFR